MRSFYPIEAELILGDKGPSRDKIFNKSQRLYLHFYFNQKQFKEEESRLNDYLEELEMIVKDGFYVEVEDYYQREIEKYFDIYLVGEEMDFQPERKEDVYAKATEDFGYYALISSSTDDCFLALEKDQLSIEDEGLFVNTSLGAHSDSCSLRGVTFCQCVLVGYYNFLYQKIKNLKESLQKDIQDTELDEQDRKEREDLLKWLNDETMQNILEQLELTELSYLNKDIPINNKLDNEKNIKREKLFYQLLGLPS